MTTLRVAGIIRRIQGVIFSFALILGRLLMPDGPGYILGLTAGRFFGNGGRGLRHFASIVLCVQLIFSGPAVSEVMKTAIPQITPQPFSPRSLIGVEIPPILGTLTDRFSGAEEKLVIHLQDSHAHFEAQKNISKLISFFFRSLPEGMSRMILLEGANGLVDTSPLAAIDNDQIKERIAAYFLTQGLIGGAEYYAIMAPQDVLLVGVDDRELYLKNLEYFQKCQRLERDLENEMRVLSDFVSLVEQSVFSQAVLELNKLRRSYEQGEPVLGPYCKLLKSHWTETGNFGSFYPNLERIVRVTQLEAGIRYDRINEELVSLIAALQKVLSKRELDRLVEKSLLYRLGKIDQGEYYRLVYGLASRAKLDFVSFPNLAAFFEAVLTRDQMDPARIFKELDECDQRIRTSLYRSPMEKEFDRFTRYLASTERLIRLSLTREEFEFYLKEKSRYPVAGVPALLNDFAVKNRVSSSGILSTARLSDALSDLEHFYDTALKRDQAILSNVLQKMDEERSPVTILITGGFHTPGLTEEFRRRKVSYMVVAPKVTSAPDRSAYLATMMDRISPLDRDLRSLGQRLIAPIRFALDPFGPKTDWERIMAKAIFFKEFLERVRETEGVSLVESYLRYVNERLVPAKRPDGTARFPDAELKARINRLRSVAEKLTVEWGNLFEFEDSIYVPVHLAGRSRIVRLDKAKPIAIRDLEVEEFGQLDENVTFYILPEKYVALFETLSRVKKIAAEDLNPLLEGLAPPQIQAFSRMFKNVNVTGISKIRAKDAPVKQFSALQKEIPRKLAWEQAVAHSYRFEDDQPTQVKSVNVVRDLMSSTKRPSMLENRFDLVHATAVAARRAIRWLSDSGDSFISKRADKEGARWLRAYFNALDWFKGRVVIGEGERDKAPMLYIGEELGRGEQKVDMAMDVIELTKGIIKKPVQGTVSIVAYSSPGGLLNAPDVYMRKILVGPQARGSGIDVTKPISWNLEKISEKLDRPVSELRGAMLLRGRHKKMIRDLLLAGIAVDEVFDPRDDEAFEHFWKRITVEVKKTGLLRLGNLTLMDDGDLMPSFGLASGKLDFILGAGGAPEGVISAAVIESIGGEMSAQLSAYDVLKDGAERADLDRDFDKYSDEESQRLAKFKFVKPGAQKRGEIPWDKVWSSNELASGKDVVVIAAAVKDSPWIEELRSPSIDPQTGEARISTVMASKTGRVRVADITYDLGLTDLAGKAAGVRTPDEKAPFVLKQAQILGNHGLYSEAVKLLQTFNSENASYRLKDSVEASMVYHEALSRMLSRTTPEYSDLVHLLERAIELEPSENLGARDLLVRLYRGLADDALKAKSKDRALTYYMRGALAANYPGFEGDLEEMKQRLAALDVEVAARAGTLGFIRPPGQDELKKVTLLNAMWTSPVRPPTALLIGSNGSEAAVRELQEVIQKGLRRGDAVFLGGELAYPFLKYRNLIGQIPVQDPALDAVKELLANAIYVAAERKYILRGGVNLYLPLDHVYETPTDVAPLLTRVEEPFIPEGEARVDIGEATQVHYAKNLADFSFYVAAGLLGDPGVEEGGTSGLLGILMDKLEQNRSPVFFIGGDLAQSAAELGITDEAGRPDRVSGIIGQEALAMPVLSGQTLRADFVAQGLAALLRDETITPAALMEIVRGTDEIPDAKWAALSEVASYVLKDLFDALNRTVGRSFYSSDFRIQYIFNPAVLSGFAAEGALKKEITPEYLERLARQEPFRLLQALTFRSLLDRSKGEPYFYNFLNRRTVELARSLNEEIAALPEIDPSLLVPDIDIQTPADLGPSRETQLGRKILDQAA